MKCNLEIIAALVLLLATSGWAEGRSLTDTELDSITAAGYNIGYQSGAGDNALFDFDFDHTGNAHHVWGEGTLDVSAQHADSLSINTLILDRGAQQDLKALVNINAVNSVVNVLMNLVINVDSTVWGGITQLNGVHR
jgi:hypothetical protein